MEIWGGKSLFCAVGYQVYNLHYPLLGDLDVVASNQPYVPPMPNTKTWISLLSMHIHTPSQCIQRLLIAKILALQIYKYILYAVRSCVFVYISFLAGFLQACKCSVSSAGFLLVSICGLWWETETTCVEVEKKRAAWLFSALCHSSLLTASFICTLLLSCSRSFIHSISTARQLSSRFKTVFFFPYSKLQERLIVFKLKARYVFEALFSTEINIVILETLNFERSESVG